VQQEIGGYLLLVGKERSLMFGTKKRRELILSRPERKKKKKDPSKARAWGEARETFHSSHRGGCPGSMGGFVAGELQNPKGKVTLWLPGLAVASKKEGGGSVENEYRTQEK